MTEQTRRASLDLASDGARDALARFGFTRCRIWLFADENVLVLAGDASAQAAPDIAVMNEAAVHAAAESGATLQATFMGIPLRAQSVTVGYAECYAAEPIAFADAARIEAWTADFAMAIASANATEALEEPPSGRILIAEDDAAIRKLLQTLLSRKGFTVTAVGDGLSACNEAPALQPDLILLDWMMPLLDGRSATARLKSDPRTRAIPVIMLTSQARTEDKVSALEAGAQDYLTKPFDSRELVARIQQQLRWRRLLSDDGTPAVETPAAAATPVSHADQTAPAPPPKNGDYWTAAVTAQQMGNLRHALEYYVQEAENCDAAKLYPRAAIAFRSASVVAGQLQNPELSNKFLRLAGKMYLCWAESASDGKAMQEAYVNAARCFLSAGNLQLAHKAVGIAESMRSVMGDDQPSSLR
ncbi:MAG TPA: response regulator [Candidatus Aquilonibacter sp.]|nr:response regulator [Candidatus Aquilonibacter sp.]